jgi:hypothetical protein
LRLDPNRADRIFQAEFAQDDRRIGGDLNAGADLRQHFGLFEDDGFDALMPQCDRDSESTDTAACNEYTHGYVSALDQLSDFT